jgi:uncharacterized protein
MPLEIAQPAVDRFLERSEADCHISFYGGEPLLNLDLIKRTIAHAEAIIAKNVQFNMTTNGTLLTPAVCNYLREKKIRLTISLDGPRNIHDRNRVDKNGQGSFDTVMKNLAYLKHLDEKYYCKHINFSIVSAPPYELNSVHNFFTTEPLVRANHFAFSYMDYTIEHFDCGLCEDEPELADQQQPTFLDDYVEQIRSRHCKDEFLSNLYEPDFASIYHRSKIPLAKEINPNGCCVPGSVRLFVNTKGTLYACEKMEKAYPMGTVNDWMDVDLTRKLVTDYIEMSADCLDCWVCRLCGKCFASFATPDGFDPEVRQTECTYTREHWHDILVRYYTLIEENESALDYLSEEDLWD